MSACTNRLLKSTLAAVMAGITFLAGLPPTMAADHGDGPFVSGSVPNADTGDAFLFLDPNDNTRLVIAMTLQGFIPAGEAVNFSVFDPLLTYRFELETTGDARPDRFIDVTFSRKVTSGVTPQTATITIRRERPKVRRLARFRAPTTPSNLSATSPAPVVTPVTTRFGVVDFFAGEVDDTFTFDIPGFARFVGPALDTDPNTNPNPAMLQRGRDTFAGYNNLAIALRFPLSLLGNLRGNNIVGLNATTRGFLRGRPDRQLDRSGNPAVNVALIPFPRKDEHNRATTEDDANGRFTNSIVATLTALGTLQPGIDLLASLAVTNGDFLRVNLGIPNTGLGGGDNAGAAFPNGRRLGDDVIDTILNVVSNGGITTGTSTGPNEQPLRDVFPFFPPTHQPFVPGTLDDRTRN
ncbi:MAG: DUF4331 family protein [Gammaproteobacteria bacterium]|nr:DUF4331 family protein [Gammaproteobacteria bacterium]